MAGQSKSSGPIKIDFSGVVDITQPVPTGEYPVRVVKVEVKEGPKAPYLNWELAVTAPEQYSEKRLWLITSLSPNALFRLQSALIAMGESESAVKGNFNLNPAKYVGRTCVAVVTVEEYEGVERNRVVDILPTGSTVMGPPMKAVQGNFDDNLPF